MGEQHTNAVMVIRTIGTQQAIYDAKVACDQYTLATNDAWANDFVQYDYPAHGFVRACTVRLAAAASLMSPLTLRMGLRASPRPTAYVSSSTQELC